MIRPGSSSKKYMVTYTLIAINAIVYAYTALLSNDAVSIDNGVLATYGQFNLAVLEGHAYWQLLTSMFVHVSIVHIAGNMLFLFIFGLRAEDMFSLPEYLAVYLLSGLTGNVLTLAMGTAVLSAGASGAIFGLFGAVTIYSRRVIGQSIIGGLVFAFILLIINTGADVNILAHLGGIATGLLIGYGLANSRRSRITYDNQFRR
jgi:rhomboid protease GluP